MSVVMETPNMRITAQDSAQGRDLTNIVEYFMKSYSIGMKKGEYPSVTGRIEVTFPFPDADIKVPKNASEIRATEKGSYWAVAHLRNRVMVLLPPPNIIDFASPAAEYVGNMGIGLVLPFLPKRAKFDVEKDGMDEAQYPDLPKLHFVDDRVLGLRINDKNTFYTYW